MTAFVLLYRHNGRPYSIGTGSGLSAYRTRRVAERRARLCEKADGLPRGAIEVAPVRAALRTLEALGRQIVEVAK